MINDAQPIRRDQLQTAQSMNDQKTGRIELPNRLPYNEFTNDIDGMPSGDIMYHHYQKDYTEIACVQCGSKFWRKKDRADQSDLCGVCHKKNIEKLVEQNKDNL